MIGQFRNRITIRRYGQPTQTAGGGLVSGPTTETVKWAKIESRSGFSTVDHAQREWNYDYKITVRYTPFFVEKNSDEIEYKGKIMTIRSIVALEEGKEKFFILRCSINE